MFDEGRLAAPLIDQSEDANRPAFLRGLGRTSSSWSVPRVYNQKASSARAVHIFVAKQRSTTRNGAPFAIVFSSRPDVTLIGCDLQFPFFGVCLGGGVMGWESLYVFQMSECCIGGGKGSVPPPLLGGLAMISQPVSSRLSPTTRRLRTRRTVTSPAAETLWFRLQKGNNWRVMENVSLCRFDLES